MSTRTDLSLTRTPRTLALLAALSLACRAPESRPADPLEAAVIWETIGTSVEGRAIRCAAFDRGEETVLFLAGIHGDEAAGGPLLLELADQLAADPTWSAGRRISIVPEANPDGLARGTRHNARGVDLNRNFPAMNWEPSARHGDAPLSEPEARALHELVLRESPARILSFHQAAELIDFDGPGEELARALDEVGPLSIKRMGSRPGSLGSYAGLDLGIPVITVELPRAADAMTEEELWAAYGPLLVAAIRFDGS